MDKTSILGITTAHWTAWEHRKSRLFRKPEVFQVTHEFECWSIDGQSLNDIFVDRNSPRPGVSTVFNDVEVDPSLQVSSLRALLRLPPIGDVDVYMSDGRVALLFCCICADLNCATLSTHIDFEDDVVHWRDIAWQVDYDDYVPDPIPWNWISASFDRQAYESFIRSRLAEVEYRLGR